MIGGIQPITFNACFYVVSTIVLYLLKEYSGIQLTVAANPLKKDHDLPGKRLFECRDQENDNSPYQAEPFLDLEPREVAEEEKANNGAKFSVMTDESHGCVLSSSPYRLDYFAVLIGSANFGGSLLQQIGLVTVTAAKTAFITNMYIVFVPIVEFLFIPKYRANHMRVSNLLAILLSVIGLYLLSGCLEAEVCVGGAIQFGEIIVFISTLSWTASIIFTDFAVKYNLEVIALTFYQFCVTTVLTIICGFYLESNEIKYPFTAIRENWIWILSVGIINALAFVLSTLGQMHISPTRLAVLFALSSVFSAIGAYFFLHETLTWIEICGAFIMTFATTISSVQWCEEKSNEEEVEKGGGSIPVLNNTEEEAIYLLTNEEE